MFFPFIVWYGSNGLVQTNNNIMGGSRCRCDAWRGFAPIANSDWKYDPLKFHINTHGFDRMGVQHLENYSTYFVRHTLYVEICWIGIYWCLVCVLSQGRHWSTCWTVRRTWVCGMEFSPWVFTPLFNSTHTHTSPRLSVAAQCWSAACRVWFAERHEQNPHHLRALRRHEGLSHVLGPKSSHPQRFGTLPFCHSVK